MAEVAGDVSRVGFIVLRSIRRPIMVLLWVYSIAIVGMTLIPGIEINGAPQYMSIFHAFYFMTYTATTTGFGEIPVEFSDAQRIWAIVCLYVSVIAWFYAVGAIISLFQNHYFQQALAEKRFTRSVARMPGDFFILCGFGDAGSLLARGLSDAGISAAIIEIEPSRIQALLLRDYRAPMPGLCADASVPKHLLEAGLRKKECQAIVAMTNDEEVNLRISALARLLNPEVRIITVSKVDIYEETLETLGRDMHIVDPFKSFAKDLGYAIHMPTIYTLNQWMVGAAGATLDRTLHPPRGTWIISGYGRMGHEVHKSLVSLGISTAVIDTHTLDEHEKQTTYIVGSTTAKTLLQAGIKDAVGILAATDDDGHNLGILLNARALNPNLFTIVRQNKHHNEAAFAAANADIIMQPSLVTARRVLYALVAPLLKPFFGYLMDEHVKGNQSSYDIIDRLRMTIGRQQPELLTVFVNREKASALVSVLGNNEQVLLGDLVRYPGNYEKSLSTEPLAIQSGDETIIMPGADHPIRIDDQILFCGTESAHRLLDGTLNNEYILYYARTGKFKPRGYFMQWVVKQFPELLNRKKSIVK
ncbi:MAG: NAD-binding protein [Methylococcales bacterium]